MPRKIKNQIKDDIFGDMRPLTIVDRLSKLTYVVSILLLILGTLAAIVENAANNADSEVFTKNCKTMSGCSQDALALEQHDWDRTTMRFVLLIFFNVLVGFIRYRYVAKGQNMPKADAILVLIQWGLLLWFYIVCLNVLTRSMTVPITTGQVSATPGSEYENMTIVSDWVSNSSQVMGDRQKSLNYSLAFVILAVITQFLSSLGCYMEKQYSSSKRNRKSIYI